MSEGTSTPQDPMGDFLGTIEFFSVFTPTELKQLADNAETLHFSFGDTIFELDEKSVGIYLIRKGSVRLFSSSQGKERSLGIRKEGDIFDELGAIREHNQEYSVRASAKCDIVRIPRSAFKNILENNKAAAHFITNYAAIRMAGGIVNRLFDLKGKVAHKELEQYVNSVGVKRVSAGKTILEQDSQEDRRLYIIHQGKVKLNRTEEGTEYSLANLGRGDSFGELSALGEVGQFASAVAETDAILLVIPENTLGFVLERNKQALESLEKKIESSEREIARQKKLAQRRKRSFTIDMVSKPGLGEKVLRRFPLIEQAEETDCGAACLAMICKHYGISMTLGKLRDMANVTTEGATLDSLAKVGESLGFSTRGVQCTFDTLQGFELPFIAHWEGYHYIIVYGISKKHVWVADPARGYAKMTVEEFEKGWSGTCLVFSPGQEFRAEAASASPWARFASYLSPFKSLLGYLILATVIIELLGVAPPIIMQNILDRVVVHQNVSLLNVLIVGLIIVSLFTNITSSIRGMLSAFMLRKLDFTMISQFFQHVLSLPLGFFDSRRTGDIFARFQENMTVRDFMTESTISTLLNVLMMFIYFIVLFMYSAKMTFMLIGFIIPIALFTVLITPKMKDYARREFETATDAESVLMETISGAETVKAMGIERAMRMRWEKKYVKSLEVQYNAQRFDTYTGFISELLSTAATVSILWVGANSVIAGQLTIGQLMAFNMLMGSAMSPVMALIGMWDELQETAVAMERLGDVLDVEPEQNPGDSESRILLPDLRGHIKFDNVYFRYGGKETPYVLENISLDIEPGQMIAIVGQSGSGKTTLAKLIVGFYAPSEGHIYVDDYDINLVDKQYFRSQLGYVMQGNLLFSGSVTENIAAGDENPDQRRVVEAAKLADAHGFVSAMPLGYEQKIGERGTGLSGGQIQRVCIARALYHDPKVLILDEATSALDTQSESNILENMHAVLNNRTSVVIAHRLSTIMRADKILVLYDGNIVEEGSHQELLARQGMYHQLVHRQVAEQS